MMNFTNFNVLSILLYFDQSSILYTGIFGAETVGMVFILIKWCSRKAICVKFISCVNIEIIWTILPILIICIILVNSIPVIYCMELGKGLSLNYLSVIGNQWHWSYNNLESRISSLKILVDQPLFINSGIQTILLISSSDVIHSFSIPSLGVKVDGIPGRLNCVNLVSVISGTYIGYCSELCGLGHGLMPINLVVYYSVSICRFGCFNLLYRIVYDISTYLLYSRLDLLDLYSVRLATLLLLYEWFFYLYDKIISSVFSIFSIYVVYVYILVIEYGFIMHYLNILIVCSSLTLVSG